MFRQSRGKFSKESKSGWLAPSGSVSRPALVLLHSGHGLWDSSVASLIEEIEHIDGELLVVEASHHGSPSLEDARAAAAFLGAEGTVTLEVPGGAGAWRGGRGWRGASRAAENIVAKYREALSEQDFTLMEAV